uniref:Uncharacterized protein n=1 Tax=Rhizophora mucronata TaxID=61149 RepID=A0A2P2N4U1_RHIMU
MLVCACIGLYGVILEICGFRCQLLSGITWFMRLRADCLVMSC